MLRTPLYDIHVSLGARLVDFAGWEMPILFTGIVEEHLHTRSSCSLFDVSHMGRLELRGPDAQPLLDRLVTRNLARVAPGQAAYAHMCREDGGILDDVLVYRYDDHWMVVCNASNREKIVAWIRAHLTGRNVELLDRTEQTAMIAVQGPRAIPLLDAMLPVKASELKRYRFTTGDFMGMRYTLSRTGYTGEDGVEVIVPAPAAEMAYNFIQGEDSLRRQVKPAGLGARDTLRLEAAMPLYGHELTEDIDSISAGQDWCVHLDHDFIGVEALRRVKEHGPARRLVGLELAGKRIARQGADILADNRPAGVVTSGTMSPTLGKSIAMGFVAAELAAPGSAVRIDLRGRVEEARVVPLPFYKLPK